MPLLLLARHQHATQLVDSILHSVSFRGIDIEVLALLVVKSLHVAGALDNAIGIG